MIYSMTAFARCKAEGDWGTAIWELRSFNHRYLELTIRLPETLNTIESTAREKLKSTLQRGKVECLLRYEPPAKNATTINVNTAYVKQLLLACNKVTKQITGTVTLNPLEILNWPGVIQTKEIDFSKAQKHVLAVLNKTIQELLTVRSREGSALKTLLESRLKRIDQLIKKVQKRLPKFLNEQREKLVARFTEAALNPDPSRLEQETVMYAQKIDISEELERLSAHVLETHYIIQKGGTVGRRLDFLMQELHREANTLGSKSADANIISIAVELKVLIEQMREQIQNIE